MHPHAWGKAVDEFQHQVVVEEVGPKKLKDSWAWFIPKVIEMIAGVRKKHADENLFKQILQQQRQHMKKCWRKLVSPNTWRMILRRHG